MRRSMTSVWMPWSSSSSATESTSWTTLDQEMTVTSPPPRTTLAEPMGTRWSAGGLGPFIP